ncbi:MAG: ribonuclease H-like domain-containing protein [Acidobacteriia bacterium]|nr:ribonuclease H-like domain-containing protein [Terriglobia bacterium]
MKNREEEIEKRRQRARGETFSVAPVHSTVVKKFLVKGASGRAYQIVLDRDINLKSCECHDFLSSGLGTCKHIEAVLIQQQDRGNVPPGGLFDSEAQAGQSPDPHPEKAPRHLVCFDVETQNSFDDVGGRSNFDKLRISVAVLYDESLDQYFVYNEAEASQLVDHLFTADLVVGYNLLGFDYAVLQPYSNRKLGKLPTLDLMRELEKKLGFRVKLDSVANATLGARKSGHGLQAIEWFRAGEIEKLTRYCQDDVKLTYDLFRFGATQGYVSIDTRGSRQRVLVDWK